MIEIRNLTVEFGGVRGLNDRHRRYWRQDHRSRRAERRRQNDAAQCHEWLRQTVGGHGDDGWPDLLRIPMSRRAAFGVRRTFQTEQVVENLTVWNNVAAALDNIPTGGRARRDLIGEALELCRHDPPGGAGRRCAQCQRAPSGRDRALHPGAAKAGDDGRAGRGPERGRSRSFAQSDRRYSRVLRRPGAVGRSRRGSDLHDLPGDAGARFRQQDRFRPYRASAQGSRRSAPPISAPSSKRRHEPGAVGFRLDGRAGRQADHPRRRHRNSARQDHGASRRQRRWQEFAGACRLPVLCRRSAVRSYWTASRSTGSARRMSGVLASWRCRKAIAF